MPLERIRWLFGLDTVHVYNLIQSRRLLNLFKDCSRLWKEDQTEMWDKERRVPKTDRIADYEFKQGFLL